MRISFLLHNAYHIGGTIRTTFTLAQVLAERHEVEIVSVFRHRDEPILGLPAGVTLRHLVDLRKDSPGYDGEHRDFSRPATVFPRGDGRWKQYSALTDARIGEHLAGVEADVLVATRPGLNVHLAKQARRGPVLVGQEHLVLAGHTFRLRREIRHQYALLDAVTTVTEADARAYRSRLKLPGVRIDAVPNSVPAPSVAPADPVAKIVVAAGRLTRVKRYDVLIDAFAEVTAARPDWKLRIYGTGDAVDDMKATLARRIKDRGLEENVFLMGWANPMEPEWAKGSIAAVTSLRESFGMTIVEAMRCGLPVVSTDCHGPREIIEDGVDGRLVPVDDVAAIARALLDLIEDDELRAKTARAALTASERFDPVRIAARHEEIWSDLVDRGASGRTHGGVGEAVHRTVGGAIDAVYELKRRAGVLVRRFR
ncbi:glycosyltransferase family 4 protein [Streptomyces sp. NBC_01353]|uniref:glycosyltransferase family 4 protein n=1 Tax=Streptomyces sp. NBC_01353 TaxID=2903835 RepID=UPI002E338D83|nr:glycosyltransferase family 4 protein [Streptomyces sp. NBC_01353]